MSWIDNAERKFGRFAIPGVLRIIGIFQLLVFVLSIIPNTAEVIQFINLNPARFFSGEIWRAFTFVFVPRSSSPLWIIIMVMFLFFISDGLEEAWGSFKLNLYVFGTILCILVAVLVLRLPLHSEILFASLIMAFAYHYPHTTIMLFFVIPLKMKYLGFITAGFLVLSCLSGPTMALATVVGLIPFFAVFGPKYLAFIRNQSETAARRKVYEDASVGTGEAFHTCHQCGATDVANPGLEFRVAADGEEYCDDCRSKAAAES